jgi:uncharacterized protein YecE (DUF72 family)
LIEWVEALAIALHALFMEKIYRIGCSGYYYPAWKNKFYPAGLPTKSWLSYYSSVFNTVELNGTFYRTPTAVSLKKNADATPADFKFSVKMSRYITHVLKMKACTQQVSDFQALIREGLGNKLSCFLFQLPPSFHYSEENMERLLESIPPSPENVVEFRHLSWWNARVKTFFEKARLTFCNVDFPGLDSYFIQTGPLFYLRLHGKPELFKSSYDIAQLSDFYHRFPEKTGSHFVYFNNTFFEAGYTNAKQLKEIIQR